jgi:hypothetical protein
MAHLFPNIEQYNLKVKQLEDILSKNQDIILLNRDEALDEIHFWGQQMMEHSLFLHLGIEDTILKSKGLELYQKWKFYMDTTFINNGIQYDKVVLDQSDLNKLSNVIIEGSNIFGLIDELRNYKLTLIDLLKKGQWIGWLWLSFVKHILRELEFFNLRLNGVRLTPSTEAFYWNVTNSEHLGAGSHLIDPMFENDKVISKADTFYHDILKLMPDETPQYLDLSLKYSIELDKFNTETKKKIENNTLKSVIHPTLADHIGRESKRSLYFLQG